MVKTFQWDLFRCVVPLVLLNLHSFLAHYQMLHLFLYKLYSLYPLVFMS